MSKDIIYPRLFIAGCIACGALFLQMKPALATSGDRPHKKKVAVAQVAKIDPDRVVVVDFFKAAQAAAEEQEKLTPGTGYGFEHGVFYLPETWCIERLSLPKDKVLERCMVRDVGERRVAVLIVVSDWNPNTAMLITGFFRIVEACAVRRWRWTLNS
jgi:hypothetical protein